MAKDVPQQTLDQLADLARQSPEAPDADQVKGGAGPTGGGSGIGTPTLKPISSPKLIVPCI